MHGNKILIYVYFVRPLARNVQNCTEMGSEASRWGATMGVMPSKAAITIAQVSISRSLRAHHPTTPCTERLCTQYVHETYMCTHLCAAKALHRCTYRIHIFTYFRKYLILRPTLRATIHVR